MTFKTCVVESGFPSLVLLYLILGSNQVNSFFSQVS